MKRLLALDPPRQCRRSRLPPPSKVARLQHMLAFSACSPSASALMLLALSVCSSSALTLMLVNAPSTPYKPLLVLPRRTFQPLPSPPNLHQRPRYGPPRARRRRHEWLWPPVASSHRDTRPLKCALPHPTRHALSGGMGAQPRWPASPAGADRVGACCGDLQPLLKPSHARGAQQPALVAGQRPRLDNLLRPRARGPPRWLWRSTGKLQRQCKAAVVERAQEDPRMGP
jgi:hypothetical protein